MRRELPLLTDLAAYSAAEASWLPPRRQTRSRAGYARSLAGTPEGLLDAIPRFEAATESAVLLVLAVVAGPALVASPPVAAVVLAACLGLFTLMAWRRTLRDKKACVDSTGLLVPAAGILEPSTYLLRPRPVVIAISLAVAVALSESAAILALMISTGEALDASLAALAVTAYALAALTARATNMRGAFIVGDICLASLLYAMGGGLAAAVSATVALRIGKAAIVLVGGFFGRWYVARSRPVVARPPPLSREG